MVINQIDEIPHSPSHDPNPKYFTYDSYIDLMKHEKLMSPKANKLKNQNYKKNPKRLILI